jgi:hypothetical protein
LIQNPRRKLSTKEGQPAETGCPCRTLLYALVAIVVVIVVIPIAIGVPAVAIFVPPTMAFVPAAFPRLTQIVPRVIGLPAVPTVMFDGFVQPVIRLDNAALATAVVIGAGTGRSGEDDEAGKRGRNEYRPSEKLLLSRLKLHILSILSFSPLAGMG